MRRVDVYFIFMVIVAIIAIGLLYDIAINIPAYVEVAKYINEHNLTKDVCEICERLKTTGLLN
jgi:hypothetical protein